MTWHYRRSASDSLGVVVLKILAVLAILAIVLGAVVVDCNKRQACRDRGGEVQEYNCRTSMHCSTTSNGRGGSNTSCYPSTHCDWRCVNLPAEAAP